MLHAPPRVRLLVLRTNFHHQDGRPLFAHLEKVCERSPFQIKGKEDQHVRYNNEAYMLYSPESTCRLIEKVRVTVLTTLNSMAKSGEGDVSLALIAQDFSEYFHCVLERSPGHFHRV